VGEGCEVVSPSLEFSGFINVGERLGVALQIAECSAKLCVIVSYEVWRVLYQSRGGQGGAGAVTRYDRL